MTWCCSPGCAWASPARTSSVQEDQRVLDVVLQGHVELWRTIHERDRIYADPNATDDDYLRAAELEAKVAEYDGYTAASRAGTTLIDAGIDESKHDILMREVPPGLKLRVLLAQALYSRPDVLLLDEPTNNLDIHSIGWLEKALNSYDATMIIISHDRHFLNQVCTHIADLDYQQLKVYPGNYDDFMLASVQARQRVESANAKAEAQISDLQEFVRRFSANASKARQATSRKRQIEKIKIEEVRPSSRQNPYIRFEQARKLYRSAITVEGLTPFTLPGQHRRLHEPQFHDPGRATGGDHRPERYRQDDADALSRRRLDADRRPHHLGRECPARLAMPQIPRRSSKPRPISLHGCPRGPAKRTMTRSCARPSAGYCFRETRPESPSRCSPAARRTHDLRQAHVDATERDAPG